MTSEGRIDVIMLVTAIILFVMGILLLWIDIAFSRQIYPGQWAQIAPAERDWFRSQHSPSTGIPCCDISDGVFAEEEIRADHYWAQFIWRRCLHPKGYLIAPNMAPGLNCDDASSGWVQVPDEVVIHDPNRHGAPVVWWSVDGKKVWIRCYAPGAGL